MKPYFDDGAVQLYLGDCRNVLPTLADASVDAVVTDAPYEIGFMGRGWDATGIAYDTAMWRQCWRVLKPGGHLLAFGATRTYHRLAVAVEDAGFEIRDSIHWIYGNGMPKGQNIAKGIDRRRDDRSEILKVTAWLAAARDAAGWTNRQLNEAFGFSDKAAHWTTQRLAAAVPTPAQWNRLRELLCFDDAEILPLVEQLNARKGNVGEAWDRRPTADLKAPGLAATWTDGSGWNGSTARAGSAVLPEAATWEGWNTSLRPAHEPIVVARKSTGFNTTVANVLEHGTGAINVDGCRVPASAAGAASNLGRWPTNVVFSHAPDCTEQCADGCPVAGLDIQTGTLTSGAMAAGTVRGNRSGYGGAMPVVTGAATHGDSGGASRFFPAFRYEGKAGAAERPSLDDGTTHSTVKPLDLMRWLVRLVCPPGGTILDPFIGSGTTLEACVVEGFHGIGIEQHQPYADLCVKRLSKPIQAVLGFEEAS